MHAAAFSVRGLGRSGRVKLSADLLLLFFAMVCQAAPSEGWTEVRDLIVPSDGTFSLGHPGAAFNDTRDQGSKICYFDAQSGDNATAEAYWWYQGQIVDTRGSATNPDNGQAYGTDPMNPNEAAIRPFATCVSNDSDDRLRTQDGSGGPNAWRFSGLAGGYPDVFLFRRGQTHTQFDMRFAGGRSEAEPMVVAAYGPLADGRAVMKPDGNSPFSGHNWGRPRSWMHQALFSLEIHASYGYLNTHVCETFAEGGGPTTAYLEDCVWPGRNGGLITYPPNKTTLRRCILSHCWYADAHNQAYFTSGYKNRVLMDEVILYKNGYKEDPRTQADARRDIFSRNIYQGGGARLGHVYRNIICMDGASGGPQMRFGGVIENSLIVEGYWYSSTTSNNPDNGWAEADPTQSGSTAIVRNNVQLVFACDTPADPENPATDTRAQPGWGYALQGFSYGAIVEDNIVSGALLGDDLGGTARYGFKVNFGRVLYGERTVAQRNNVFRDNIAYRVSHGFGLEGDALGAENIAVHDNVFVGTDPLDGNASNLGGAGPLTFDHNRLYTDEALPDYPWIGAGNTIESRERAATAEGWPDPDRTLKRYVTEALGLTLLDWSDDPYLDPAQVEARVNAGEAYDPAGMKTFMAVATRMRRGGVDPIPSAGKPSWTGDYPWDDRFTAIAVVNWIREGFGRPPVESVPSSLPAPEAVEPESFVDRFDGQYRSFFDFAYPGYEYVVQSSDLSGIWADRQVVRPASAGFLRMEAELNPTDEATVPTTFFRSIVRPVAKE